MSPEERDELINFILQSQSNAAEEHRAAMEEHRKSMEAHRTAMQEHRAALKRLGKVEKQSDRNTTQIQALVKATHDLVIVARIHSRRLDRLDKLNP